MSYRFCLGASGAGKSTYLHRKAVRRAAAARRRLDFKSNILIVVPDQFTMQTQKDLVLAAGNEEASAGNAAFGRTVFGEADPGDDRCEDSDSRKGSPCAGSAAGNGGGIMNIDVLSFGRLSHRIFGEIGADTGGVLDDMGKSLILRRLAAGYMKDLKVLGQKVRRPGMIAQVKSVISEFMQYGISVNDVGELASHAAAHGQGALAAKLSDLQVLYRAFLDERTHRFLTSEETLDLLAEAIPKSRLIPRCTVIFDGFTGFTPVQYRAILSLMQCAEEVIFTFDYAPDGGTPIAEVMSGAPYEEQDLFYLTRQSVAQICRLGEQSGIAHGEDIYIEGGQAAVMPADTAKEPAAGGPSAALPVVAARETQEGTRTEKGTPAPAGTAPCAGSAAMSVASRMAAPGDHNAVPPRFAGNRALAHLERSLFRNPVHVYVQNGPGPAAGKTSDAALCHADRGGAGDFGAAGSRAGTGAKGDCSEAGSRAGTGAKGDCSEAGSRAGMDVAKDSGGHSVPALPIHLILAANPGQEVRQMFIRIRKLIAQKGYHYRDIAVVTGDLTSYEDEIRVYAERYDVPVYIDTRRTVTQNPLTETVRSALEIGGGDYSYETVFRFLRGGLSGLSPDAVDRLENYCLRRGIASRTRWETAFDPEYEPARQAFLAAIRPLQAPRRGKAGRNASGNAEAAEQGESRAFHSEGNPAASDAGNPSAALSSDVPGRGSASAAAGRSDTAAPAAGASGRRPNAQDRTRALYEFLLGIHAGEQMQAMARRLREQGQDAQAMEYEQIYGEVIHLLDELYDLSGEEPISAGDYLDLVTTGFQEIRIGTLPQQVDRIPVGDMERTRLSEVRVLFVLGVNDGSIPKGASEGGLLSDLDREFLKESGVLKDAGASLAPTPREQMYIQRLYLYMNLTKPSQELYVSYAAAAADGKSLRPSYLIGLLQQMYPQLEPELPELSPVSEQMIAPKDAASFLAGALRDYADGLFLTDPARRDEVLTIYGFCARREPEAAPAPGPIGECAKAGETAGACSFPGRAGDGRESDMNAGAAGARTFPGQTGDGREYEAGACAPAPSGTDGGSWVVRLRDAAFFRYRPVPLSKDTSRAIYGRAIRGSVTRLETAANCYLHQFLQYGLRLKERELYTFEARDSGSILHDSIQRFGLLLQKEGIAWTGFTKEQGRTLMAIALRDAAGTYNDQILYASARSTYQAARLQRILNRTADTLQYQLRQGDFVPCALEQDFGGGGELSFALKGGGRLTLQGRIDRVDLAADAPAGALLQPRRDPENQSGDASAEGAGDETLFRLSDNNGARADDGFAEGAGQGAARGRLYVKIVDYKSGKKDLDPVQMKAGLQLQLMLYMMAEVDRLSGEHPGTEIVPAGMLYYRFDDPTLDGTDAQKVLALTQQGEPSTTRHEGAPALPSKKSDAQQETARVCAEGVPGADVPASAQQGEPFAATRHEGAAALSSSDPAREREEEIVRRHLRPKGLVGGGDDILQHLDRSLAGVSTESAVVPVRRNKDGSLSKSSCTYTPEEYQELSRALRETVCRLAEDILDGRTDAAPVRTDENHTACTWCAYKDSCGFDPRIPGYEYRDLKDLPGEAEDG